MTTKHLELQHDEDAGYWILLEDGVGLAKSKSRTVMVRIRAALSAPNALVGLTVEQVKDTIPNRIDGYPRGLVLGVADPVQLIVRLADDRLATWNINDCKVVDAPKPEKATPSNDPADIYIDGAVNLLLRWVEAMALSDGPAGIAVVNADRRHKLTVDTQQFLKARKRAEATP